MKEFGPAVMGMGLAAIASAALLVPVLDTVCIFGLVVIGIGLLLAPGLVCYARLK